jgi:hypothetical protein
MPPRTTRKSYRLRASDRTMVGNFCNRTACRIRNRRRRHDSNMTLQKKRTPRASQHYMGWRARQKSLLLPVAGEFFLLTLPFIERGDRRVHFSGGTLPISRSGFLVPGFVDRSTIGRLISLVISAKRGLHRAAFRWAKRFRVAILPNPDRNTDERG